MDKWLEVDPVMHRISVWDETNRKVNITFDSSMWQKLKQAVASDSFYPPKLEDNDSPPDLGVHIVETSHIHEAIGGG